MLCPMTDNGKVEISRADFARQCVKIQDEWDCMICGEGKFARLGLLDKITPPEDVTFIDGRKAPAPVAEKKKAPAAEPVKDGGFPGDERLKPIPAEVLENITVVGLKPYWRNPICKCGVPGICVNCDRNLNISSAGMCSRCNYHGQGKIGVDLVESLASVAAKPGHGPRKKKKPAAAPESSGGGQSHAPAAPTELEAWDVVPKNKWQRKRLGDLALAVHMHVRSDRFDEPCVAEWCREISELLAELTTMFKKGENHESN